MQFSVQILFIILYTLLCQEDRGVTPMIISEIKKNIQTTYGIIFISIHIPYVHGSNNTFTKSSPVADPGFCPEGVEKAFVVINSCYV